VREWLSTFPFPPIPIYSILIPSQPHSQVFDLFPFPWDSHVGYSLRWPNLAGTGKRWPSRSGWLLVVICPWIPDHFFLFLHQWGIGDFPTFVSISLFSQFSYNQQPICTKLGEMKMTPTSASTILGRIFDGHPDPDQSGNPNSNPGWLLFQILALSELCTLY